MLVSLKIENFALIDQLTLPLQPGLNVLTGETGAGKSIILDAIEAVLGGRASSRLIRSGEKKALLEATFRPPGELQDWLTQQEIPLTEEGYLICSRELTASRGAVRSRSRLNGVVVNKPQLEVLKPSLVEITAQGQTMQLGATNLQQNWLDGFGGAKLLTQRDRVSQSYQAATAAFQTLDRRRKAEQQRQQQLDLFEFQGQELGAANLEEADELVNLQQEHQRLSHAVELQQQSYQVYQILYENDGGVEACADLLGKASSILADMLRFDPEVEPIIDLVSDAMTQVEEAGRQINSYGEGVETDPERLQAIDQRISQLKQLCRKYDGICRNCWNTIRKFRPPWSCSMGMVSPLKR